MATPSIDRLGNEGKGGTRITRGIALYREHEEEIVVYLDGTFGVPSSTTVDFVYHVDLSEGTCTCPDSEFRRATCLHQVAASIKESKRRSRVTTPVRVCRRSRRAA